MFPVSGAEQLKTMGVTRLRPMTSQSIPYSQLVNPTLTTQALATRTAEKVFKRYFDGDPWVKSDSPVTSTERKVTRAVRALDL